MSSSAKSRVMSPANFLRRYLATSAIVAQLFAATTPFVQAEEVPAPQEPAIAAASKEGETAIQGFRIPADLKISLVAGEPQLANPVAFGFDNQGRIFVCETFRQGKGVEDNRGHSEWLDEDLAAMTVADRVAYIKRHLGEKASDYTKQDDRIRLLEDTDGDGKIDKATVFSDRYNQIEDGTGAGVLFHRGDLFYTNIPHLWRLRDINNDGKADERVSLSSGYGVKFAFRGHDMHGLIMGPDGKVYYSIGDRGLNVKTPDGRQLINVSSGAVIRCNPDGSELELFATGLRNPQELAFDDFGNLFTGDNNSDSGDQARWVHVHEGGDTGWRMEYQYLGDRGPFNREKIWHPYQEGQPAYIVPPITNFASGPSGLAYYPGTGLPERYKGRFFLADFRGTPNNSGIRTFKLKPSGASFELVEAEETLWSILATDVDFGPDGGVYVSDWVNGWNGEGKGRIYRYADPEVSNSEIVKQVKALLAGEIKSKSIQELVSLLGHSDRRVRQEAQFLLVDKKASAELLQVATTSQTQLARVHAIWALGQLGNTDAGKADLAKLTSLLSDGDIEVKANLAKVLGDRRISAAFDGLVAQLADENLRVRYHAAMALGKIGNPAAIDPLLTMLAENADQDAPLRHAGVMGLTGSAKDPQQLIEKTKHSSASARMGLLLALRRHQSPAVASFLRDADPRLITEAARVIHDLPIESALPQLATTPIRGSQDDALLRRVLNANFRLGTPETANRLADFAAEASIPEPMRLEALSMLASWKTPSPKDRVLNFWRPLAERDANVASTALRGSLAGIFRGSPKVQAEAAKVAASLGITEVGPALLGLLQDKGQSPTVRGESLVALETLKFPKLNDALDASLKDEAAAVRAAALAVLARQRPQQAIEVLKSASASPELVERQAAFEALASVKHRDATSVLAAALEKLLADDFPKDTRLDLTEAAAKRKDGSLEKKLAEYRKRFPSEDPLSKFVDCQEGGSAERGRRIFLEKTQVSCVRCHKVASPSEGHPVGGDVGPELSKIGVDKTRQYLLEAVATPSKAIAKGFETVIVVDSDGRVTTGVVKLETPERLDLMTAEGKLVSIAKSDIEDRKTGKSSMPEDLTKHLSLQEVRDLIAYLASLK